MNNFLNVFYIAISIIFLFSIINYILERNKIKEEQKQKEEELILLAEKEKKEKKLRDELLPFITQIIEFNNSFDLFSNQMKYISNYDVYIFKSKYYNLFKDLKHKNYKQLSNFDKEIKLISDFIIGFNDIAEKIKFKNYNFISNEIIRTKDLLSNIEGKSLDKQQRKSILTDEDNHLVIAGAGSGKTTTIAGKVKYLSEFQKVPPENILLISFTRKSADEMQERIKEKLNIDIQVKTFHKLGLDIISESSNEKPSIYDSSGKSHLNNITSFINHSKKQSSYYDALIDFLSYYLKPYISINDFSSDKEHNDYLNNQKLEGYKIVKKITKDGVILKYRERFKSQEEVLIANFLFRNGIKYEYEEKYQFKTASKMFSQYKPDFYLPDYDIYIEHFGVDENWNVPKWFKGHNGKSANEIYNEAIHWKRNEHLSNGTKLIETYSWQQKKGILLSELKVNLLECGVEFNPISNEDLWKYLEENSPEEIGSFTQLIDTFLVLFKTNNEMISNLKRKAISNNDDRASKFLDLFEPIFLNYENFLKEKNEIDFSDMINKASFCVYNNQFISNYKYIIIDEFQDISLSRYKLIKSLIDQKPSTKLFCVGDDWQSIFRFAGSDIGIFTNFEDLFKSSTLPEFERKTSISYIENTYRFDNKLIELSSNFILKNPNQIKKSLKSFKNSELVPFTVLNYSDPDKKGNLLANTLESALFEISNKNINVETSILLVGRYDFEKNNIQNNNQLLKKIYNKNTNSYYYVFNNNELHKITFLTAHKSKGLEADYVIILNCNSGTYGFPSEISDDPLLNFLLSDADHFPNGEERRLFYVAMTRAKKHVYFLSSNEYPSKFLEEIEKKETATSLNCEWCDNGRLIERKGPYGLFYACNNIHYCNFKKKANINEFLDKADNYLKLKDYEKSIKYYERYLEFALPTPDILFYLGKAYELNGILDRALFNFTKCLELDANYKIAYLKKGIVLFHLKNYNEAIKYLEKFNSLEPYKNSVNNFLAVAYFKIKKYDYAISYINKEILENKNNNLAIKLKSDIIKSISDILKEKEYFVTFLKLNNIKDFIDIAISNELDIKFNYHKSLQFDGGIKSFRTISPVGYKMVGNSKCIYGFCYLRNEERTFNIERISNLVINPDKTEFWSE